MVDRLFAYRFSVCIALCTSLAAAQFPSSIQTTSNPGQTIDFAKELISVGFYDKAVEVLEGVLTSALFSDQHDEILLLLSQCYFAQYRYEDAFQMSSRYLANRTTSVQQKEALYYNALSAYHTERYDAAANAFETLAKENFSDSRSVYYWHALTELNRGNVERATDLARLAHESAPSSDKAMAPERTLLLWAIALEQKGETRAAKERFERIIEEYPGSPLIRDATLRLAAISFRQRDYAGARVHLAQVNPATARQKHEWLFLMADVEYWTGNYDQAQHRYRELLKEFPRGEFSRQAHFGLANTYLHLNKLTEAKQEFRQVTGQNDSLAQVALYQIGTIALLQGNTSEAMTAFEELAGRFPYDAYADNAYFQIGMMRYRTQQVAEGRRQFQLAARLFPESEIRPDAYRMLGEASLAVGDMRNAQFAFGQVRKLLMESPSKQNQALLAEVRLKEGIALYHLGRFNTSAERFEEFIREHRNHQRLGDGHFWRGEALYQAGKFEEAEQAFATALTLLRNDHPRRIEALYGQAWALFEQKKFRKALTAFDRFIEENPRGERTVDARLRQADCYFFLREYDSANQLYAKLAELKSDPRLAEYAAFQLGLSFIQRGDTERGIEHLRDFLRRHPNSVYVEVVQFNIAWSYFSREQYGRALEEFRMFERLYPESQLMPRVLLNSGDALYNLAQYDSARVYYRRVIEEYPKSLLVPDATNGLQFTYRAQGRAQEAVAALEEIVSKRANQATGSEELLMQKAEIHFDQGEFGPAAIAYLRILDLQPADSLKAKVLFQLGRIYELENNLPRATSYFNQIVMSFPHTDVAPPSLLSLGLLAARQKQWNLAMAHLNQFEGRYPTSPLRWEAEYNIGVAQLGLKNTQAARAQFQKVAQSAPRDEVFADRSRLQLARMHQSAKQYAEAIDTLTDIVARRDDDIAAEALLLLGEVYLALKKPSDALQSFSRVVEGFSTYPLLVERGLLGSGECYERLNDRAQARKMYAKVAETAVDPMIKNDAEDRLRRLRR